MLYTCRLAKHIYYALTDDNSKKYCYTREATKSSISVWDLKTDCRLVHSCICT